MSRINFKVPPMLKAKWHNLADQEFAGNQQRMMRSLVELWEQEYGEIERDSDISPDGTEATA